MSSASTLFQVVIAVGLLALVIGRRFMPRPIQNDTRRWRLPLAVSAIGVYDVASLSRHTPPVTITGTDLAYLLACGFVSLLLGVLRGSTIRIYPVNGELVQRYSALTTALWIFSIAVRIAMDLAAPPFGVATAVASTSLLLMFGISLLGESLAVSARIGTVPARNLP